MSVKTFIDSNVFLYVMQSGADAKSSRASEWLRYLKHAELGVTNLQVLNEVTNVLLKRSAMLPEDAFAAVDGFSGFGSSSINSETVAAARILRFETGYAWWDCLLLASAVELQCRVFLSEDMRDNHQLRGLTIVNPFRHSPPQAPLH